MVSPVLLINAAVRCRSGGAAIELLGLQGWLGPGPHTCVARVSASSLPLRPQWAGIHCRVVLYLLDRFVSFVNRLCCLLSLLLLFFWRTERASVRNTTLFFVFFCPFTSFKDCCCLF